MTNRPRARKFEDAATLRGLREKSHRIVEGATDPLEVLGAGQGRISSASHERSFTRWSVQDRPAWDRLL